MKLALEMLKARQHWLIALTDKDGGFAIMNRRFAADHLINSLRMPWYSRVEILDELSVLEEYQSTCLFVSTALGDDGVDMQLFRALMSDVRAGI